MTLPVTDNPLPSFRNGDRVAVLPTAPVPKPYDYRVADGGRCIVGQIVEVPLGRRRTLGVVWGAGAGDVATGTLKDIADMPRDMPIVPAVSRAFTDWVAAYTLSPPGSVLKMTLPATIALSAPPTVGGVIRSAAGVDTSGLRPTAARKRVWSLLADGALPTAELARRAGVGAGVVRAMTRGGALRAVRLRRDASEPAPNGNAVGPTLSAAQQTAAQELAARVAERAYSTTLLEGVTGSGKTEVCFEAVATALDQALQAVVLVPEIMLAAQWIERFEQRFGARPVVWHSNISPAARARVWRAVADGSAQVVIGARSALFLPFAKLGLIVVDEEHDGAYKQEDGVRYHARDMAVARARIGGAAAVLASATPALETTLNVRAGRYLRVVLPQRYAAARPPTITAVDLRKTPPQKGSWGRGWLSPPLTEAVAACLEAQEQAMLFLNRRGYAPLTLCRDCGHRLRCPQCSAWLVEHRARQRLQCHHCGHSQPTPNACPKCGARDSLVACGPGIERIHEETAARFPGARIEVASSDTMNDPQAATELLGRMNDREIDVLIGTQVLAKGWHFPMLTLVGVVDADLGLEGGDLRAAERTHQLLSQVSGRAGRASLPGVVLLQSHHPDHPVIKALVSGDAEQFLTAEAEGRKTLHMPPFGRMAALIVSGTDQTTVEKAARVLSRVAPQDNGIEALGPSPAPLSLLRGRHRWRLLLKTPRRAPLQNIVRAWLAVAKIPSTIRVQVDVDPYSFL